MAGAQALYGIPAPKLDSFVAQWLQPSRGWKDGVLEVVRTVEQLLWQESCSKPGLGQEVRTMKVVKVGSFGNGTTLRGTTDVDLVVFLSCFHSFQEEAKHHQHILRLMWEKVCNSKHLLALGFRDLHIAHGVPDKLAFTILTRETAEAVRVTVVPAYRALGPSVPNSQPPLEVYVNLIKAGGDPGTFSSSFCELQRDFVKHRPTKLKSLLRLVKHWYQQYVKAKCPRANLPPLYALELLTIYAWQSGTQENESFSLAEGLATVMELLQDSELLCIYWTKYYTLQHPVIEDCVRKQLQKQRPVILDPVDPTHNVAAGYRWDIMAQRACQCLKQDCCYDNMDSPVPSWSVKRARDIQVTVEQWGHSDLILWVNPYQSIQKVKEKIRQSRGHAGLQRLSFQVPGGERQLLSGHCTLASYGIFCHTRVCLLDTVSPEIQVFVKNEASESQAYAIHPFHLVLGLKQQIEDRQGLPSVRQQLMFRGQVLQDWFDFTCYGIQDSDTLVLSQKRAGEALVSSS
ncbi:2'-5'-oligoadenylate synthase-like protein [Ctenodactylus gundi]